MNTTIVFCAVRIDGETDVIGFASERDCLAFCEARPEYSPIQTGIHTLPEALAMFN